jgi:hypothetical protein
MRPAWGALRRASALLRGSDLHHFLAHFVHLGLDFGHAHELVHCLHYLRDTARRCAALRCATRRA